MNKRILFIISFLTLITISAFSQEIKRSEVIKWIEGEKYYIHTVTQGQGLFSIRQLYGVEEKDILENNPEAFDGLKPGQSLKIPFIKLVKEDPKYRIHVIEHKQTIYSIAKLYNVTQESIFALNPETKNGYKINQKIKIPNKEIAAEEKIEDEKDQKTYKVKRKDTLYALAKKFGVTQESLMETNPIIIRDGLKKGQRIIIPGKEIIIEEALYVPLDTMYYEDVNLLNSNLPCDSLSIERSTPMNVAIFLPFELDQAAFTRETENASNKKPNISEKPFLEFYQASLLAIKDLKRKGYQLNIHTFNTKKDTNTIKEILKKGIIQELDLIIGPVYKDNFKLVQKATDSLSIPMINPIIKETNLVKESAFTIDMFPDNDIIVQQTIKLLLSNDSSQIYFVHSGFVQDMMIAKPFKEKYLNALLAAGKDTNQVFNELIFPDSKKINFLPFISKEKHNLFVVLSDNQAFVSNVFTKLNFLTDNHKVQLIARPKWQKFDNIDISYFHNLNVLQITSEYVDYQNKSIQNFIKNYRKLYHQEPSRFAFYGYDLAYNFSNYFYSHKNFKCLNLIDMEGLIFGFDIQRVNRGWMNQSIFVIHYQKDYSLKRLYQIEENLIPLN